MESKWVTDIIKVTEGSQRVTRDCKVAQANENLHKSRLRYTKGSFLNHQITRKRHFHKDISILMESKCVTDISKGI